MTVSIISFNPFSPTNKFGAFAAVYFPVTFDIRIKTKKITQTRMYGFPVQPLTSHTNNSKKKKLSICKLGTSPTNKRHYWTWHPHFFLWREKRFFFTSGVKKSLVFLPGRRKIISFRKGGKTFPAAVLLSQQRRSSSETLAEDPFTI